MAEQAFSADAERLVKFLGGVPAIPRQMLEDVIEKFGTKHLGREIGAYEDRFETRVQAFEHVIELESIKAMDKEPQVEEAIDKSEQPKEEKTAGALAAEHGFSEEVQEQWVAAKEGTEAASSSKRKDTRTGRKRRELNV